MASFSSMHEQGNNIRFSDGAFEERQDKISTRLVAPFFDITDNKQNYLLIYNDSSAEISYTILLRWMSGTYEFSGLAPVAAHSSMRLHLNELIANNNLPADKGSVELNYTGEPASLTAINHNTTVMQYDVEFKDMGGDPRDRAPL